jgi:hypothetical protein
MMWTASNTRWYGNVRSRPVQGRSFSGFRTAQMLDPVACDVERHHPYRDGTG